MKFKKIIVTGGCGFIGSNFINYILNKYKFIKLLNIDALTYAANNNLNSEFKKFKNYKFKKINLKNFTILKKTIYDFKPDAVFHFAAESHVDNSIKNPDKFLSSNINGTVNLLKVIDKKVKLFHISTDEVFGHVIDNKAFSETTNYNPRSPYSASKASSDFFVKAWANTYGLDYIIIHCCNNYGPNQNKEKFIPKIINNLKNKRKIPLYGNGKQKREWIYVLDFVKAIEFIANKKIKNQNIMVGSKYGIRNKDLIYLIKDIMQKKFGYRNSNKIINHVADRPGHDFEYKINFNKLKKLGWRNNFNIKEGLERTIRYYLKIDDK